MENNLEILFKKEQITIMLNILQPDLAKLIHIVIANNINVEKDNIEVNSTNPNFDIEEFIEILVTVHEEFNDELNKFYNNIQREISTYYSEDELGGVIIDKIKSKELESYGVNSTQDNCGDF